MSEDPADPFGRKERSPGPFGDEPEPKHEWLPPAEPREPRSPSPESPGGWQPPGASPPAGGGGAGGGWQDTPGAPAFAQPPAAGGSGKATASLVLGICGLVVCPLVCSVLALVFGYQARKEIDRTGVGRSSRGNATAGIVLGWIGTALSVLGIALIVVLALAGELDEGTDDGYDESFDEFSTVRLAVGIAARASMLVTG